jgi:MoCo/4Fe-4S cofactor protein with predicted Tat translocation signal
MSAELPRTHSRYWQSLPEAGASSHQWEAFEKVLPGEFPHGVSEWLDPVSRRRFLKLMSASIALAGVGACTRQPLRPIVPYVRQPEELIPGRPLFFATALTLAGFTRGVLVETHEGRPTKIEGNPDHPASRGASDVFMQAEILVLYDPDRSQTVIKDGQISSWDSFLGYLSGRAQAWKSNLGSGLRVLTRHETSPTFRDQMERLLSEYPAAGWHEYEPDLTNIPCAVYHLDRAEIIFSIGADFLSSGPASLIQQRDFAAARRVTDRPRGMSRLYVVESTPSLTGAMADHRIPSGPDGIADLLREIRTALEPNGTNPSPAQDKFVSALVGDLRQSAGKSLVIAGGHEAPMVQEFARWCNELLGNVNVTVAYSSPDVGRSDLEELIEEINAGNVETLLIIGGNPVYDAPADLEFARALALGERGCSGVEIPRKGGPRTGLDSSRSGRRLRDRSSRLRPEARWKHRVGDRI